MGAPWRERRSLDTHFMLDPMTEWACIRFIPVPRAESWSDDSPFFLSPPDEGGDRVAALIELQPSREALMTA